MNEIELAFSAPIDRAHATAENRPLDRISVRDYITQIDIGAFDVERAVPQRVRFNIVLEVSSSETLGKDNVDLVLSYDEITQAIDAEITGQRFNLLETLAERIAARILQAPKAHRVFVRIEKLDRGPYALGVEIVRSSAEAIDLDEEEPLRVALHILKQVEPQRHSATPTIFIMAPSEDLIVDPQEKSQAATARAWLLGLDQLAWHLGAVMPEALVCSSRTEIEWALNDGKSVIWAPQKMVLDQMDQPQLFARGFAEIVHWFEKFWQITDIQNASDLVIERL